MAAGDPAVREFIAQNGQPDYIFVESKTRMYAVYVPDDRIVRFARGDGTVSRSDIGQGIPPTISALLSPEDQERLARLQASKLNEERERRDREEREKQQVVAEAVTRMQEFVAKHPKRGSAQAYEAYLRTAPVNDPARGKAIEMIEAIQYEPYKGKGTTPALREFVSRYPENSIARQLSETRILDPSSTTLYSSAVQALEDLQTALSVGMNLGEYSHRLIDTKTQTLRAVTDAGDKLPPGAHAAIRAALLNYEGALAVWNWKVRNADLHHPGYKHGYKFWDDDTEVNAWLLRCPEALKESPPWRRTTGIWFPDMVEQCYWRDARGEVDRAKHYLQK